VLLHEEKVVWGEAGLYSKDVNRSARKAGSCPPLDLVPESRELPCHLSGGFKGVRAVAEDQKKK